VQPRHVLHQCIGKRRSPQQALVRVERSEALVDDVDPRAVGGEPVDVPQRHHGPLDLLAYPHILKSHNAHRFATFPESSSIWKNACGKARSSSSRNARVHGELAQ
jgi:hypothetical protein